MRTSYKLLFLQLCRNLRKQQHILKLPFSLLVDCRLDSSASHRAVVYCSTKAWESSYSLEPCEKVLPGYKGITLSRDTLGLTPLSSIVRVFLFSRDVWTFPRLLLWRLPSVSRSPLFSPLFPRHTSPSFSPSPYSFSLVPLSRWLFVGGRGWDLAIVGLFWRLWKMAPVVTG